MRNHPDTVQLAGADRLRLACGGSRRSWPSFAAILGLLMAGPASGETSYASSADLAQAVGETMAAIELMDASTVCFPQIDTPAKAVILSTYQGGIEFAGANPESGPTLVEVKVPATREPLYLVLARYNSVVWRIVAKPGADIAAVALSGYHQQLVLDLPAGTPLGSRAFVRDELLQSLECVHTVDLRPDQQKAWEMNTFSAIDSTVQAERLFSVLASYGPLELGEHQFQSGGDERVIFEISQ